MVGPALPREPGAGVGGVRSEPCQPRLGTLAQCRPGAGVLGSPLLWWGLTGTVSWEEPRLGLFPYRKLEKRGVEVPAHSNHPRPPTITGLSVVFCLCALGIISTQCPSSRARHLGLALPCLNHPFTSLHLKDSPSNACLRSSSFPTLAGGVRSLPVPSAP